MEVDDVFTKRLIHHVSEQGFCPCLDCMDRWITESQGLRKFLTDINYDQSGPREGNSLEF